MVRRGIFWYRKNRRNVEKEYFLVPEKSDFKGIYWYQKFDFGVGRGIFSVPENSKIG
jgi:hypothetical protein